MRSFSISVLWVVAVLAVLASCGGQQTLGNPFVVMTQDLGTGADLDAVFAASTVDVPALVDAMWAEKDQSSFATRAGAIADGIKAYSPDVVGLQSVIQWRRQIPASSTPADEVVTDYLDLLLAALAARGLAYDPVAVTTTADVELTGASGNDYRLTDREVILSRSGLKTSTAAGGTYVAERTVTVGDSTIEIRRGWASIVVEKDEKAFRFVSTHLEPVAADVQRVQAFELKGVLAGGLPTVAAGDLASEIELPSSPGYGILLAPGSAFYDAVANAGAGFPSCCRDAVCIDPAARLDRRTDFVLTTDQFQPSWGAWVHGNSTGMVDGLWPSPHAGILAGFWLN